MSDFVLGGVAGSLAEMVVLPSLVVRTRLMVQGADATSRQYSSFGHAMRSIAVEEGVGSFYKGAGANLAFTPLARGLFVLGLESSKATFGTGTPLADFATGMTAQLLSSIAYVPRDVIVERTAIDGQLKTQVGSTSSSLAALRTVLAHEGLMGFYRAYWPHQLVWVPFNGLFFTFLGQCRSAEEGLGIQPDGYLVGVGNTFVAAAAAALCTNPIDVIKTRMQVAGANPAVFSYAGPLDCLKQLIRNEGASALFAGLVGRIMYVAPNFALFLPTYDLLKRLYAAES